MSDSTKIQWADATWNVATGCAKVSAGCANCYAERDWPRHYGRQTVPVDPGVGSPPPGYEFERRPRRFTDVRCHEDRLDQPLRWKKPRRVFVNSMADLFHEAVPDEFIDRVFAVMHMSPRHTFQVLTKRPHRMREYLSGDTIAGGWTRHDRWSDAGARLRPDRAFDQGCAPKVLPNVWLGISAEDQDTADERIPILLDTPAAVRFVSAEPLLGPIDLWGARYENPNGGRTGAVTHWGGGLDWVIVGGESGPKSRPCDVAWIRDIVQACGAADVACFVKQLGAVPFEQASCRADEPQGTDAALMALGGPSSLRQRAMMATGWTFVTSPDGTSCYQRHWRLKDRKGGNPDEWPEDLRVRQFPKEVTA
jgi:protein gp37